MAGGVLLEAMSVEEVAYPCLRPLEALPEPEDGRVIMREPTGLAAGALAVGASQFLLLTLLDGTRERVQIQSDFARQSGQLLLGEDLNELLEQLDCAGFLAGPGFEAYYARL